MKKLYFYTLIFACLMTSGFSSCTSSHRLPELHIVTAVSSNNVGDGKAVAGVIHALRARYAGNIVVDATTAPVAGEKLLLLGTNVELLQQKYAALAEQNPYCCFMAHQMPADCTPLASIANLIALPTHEISASLASWVTAHGIELVPTIGVAHNTTKAIIESAYQKSIGVFTIPKPYLVVILGGDAPMADKTMLYYQPAEAAEQAHIVAQLACDRGASVIVLNGPRTGKHDPATGKEIATVHRNGQSDDVTQAFTAVLREHGFSENKNLLVCDFQFGEPSIFHAVLGQVAATNGCVVVNGDSTAMVSECTSTLEPEQVLLMANKAMNKTHHAHIVSEYEAGRAGLLEIDGTIKKKCLSGAPNSAAADAIAAAILVLLEAKG